MAVLGWWRLVIEPAGDRAGRHRSAAGQLHKLRLEPPRVAGHDLDAEWEVILFYKYATVEPAKYVGQLERACIGLTGRVLVAEEGEFTERHSFL